MRHVEGDGGGDGVVLGCGAVGGEGEGEEGEEEVGDMHCGGGWCFVEGDDGGGGSNFLGGGFERWLEIGVGSTLVMNGWVFMYSSSVPTLS